MEYTDSKRRRILGVVTAMKDEVRPVVLLNGRRSGVGA